MNDDRSRNPRGGREPVTETPAERSYREFVEGITYGRVSPAPASRGRPGETPAEREQREWVESIKIPDNNWGPPSVLYTGRPQTPPAPAPETPAHRESREWVESITKREAWGPAPDPLIHYPHTPPEPAPETPAQRETREWVESITYPDNNWGPPSVLYTGRPQTPPAPAPETPRQRETREFVESITTRKTWDSDLHPRGGYPWNIGMFSPAGDQLAQAPTTAKQLFANPDIDLDPKLFLTPDALILTTKDNYDDGKKQAGEKYPENHDWNVVAKDHGGEAPPNYLTTEGTFNTQLQDLARAGKQFDTIVLAGHGGPISPSIRWVTQRPSLDGTKQEESVPFPNFLGPGSTLSRKDKERLDLLKSLVKKGGRIIFNSCNEDVVKDPEKLKAHIAEMRKRMQMIADYTGLEVWAYPEATRGMMIPAGMGTSTWLKVQPKK